MFLRCSQLASLCAFTALFLLAGSPLFPQSTLKFERGEEIYTTVDGDGLIKARWVGPILVGIETNARTQPILYTVDRKANLERILFGIPDVGYINLSEATAGTDGTLAVAGTAQFNDRNYTTFISWISPDRRQQTFTRVYPYVADVLAIAADGTLWTIGWVKSPEDTVSVRNALNRFDRQGRVLSSSTVRAKGKYDWSSGAVMGSYLRASIDRVGWLTNMGEYIEFSLDGKEAYRIEGPPNSEAVDTPNRSLALSEDNQVIVGVAAGRTWLLWYLNRAARKWELLDVSGGEPPRWATLLGFDGADLIVREHRDISVTRRYKAEAEKQ